MLTMQTPLLTVLYLQRHHFFRGLSPRSLRKHFSTTSTHTPTVIPLSRPTYMIWGSNTSLGKTLVSTGIASSFLLCPAPGPAARKFVYLKPIQTGFPSDSDSRYVFSKLLSLSEHQPRSLLASNSVLKASFLAAQPEIKELGICELNFREEHRVLADNGGNVVSELDCETLYAWKEAVSPHLAAERESGAVEDSAVLELLEKRLWNGLEGEGQKEVLCVVETAGGVASPGPSGSLQCDLYRPFRLPGVLVGDGRLGGISTTISAYESLKLRGYDIAAVVFEDHGLVNEVPLLSYLRNRVPIIVLPPIPQDMSNDLVEWFCESQDVFHSLKESMLSSYAERIHRLKDMQKKAGDVLWWPFTQHKLVPEETVTVIDSRCGENFAVCQMDNDLSIRQQFDACASWWTQGPDATLQTELARDMGYAAARYGHVMFPENVYEPVLECAELLLEGVGKGWASRAYFSDNGSTAIEIALKMAFRKFCCDNGILDFVENNNAKKPCIHLNVLALRGSYHGDTLGAMEAQAPSSYTGFLQQPWYTGRGLFLDPPTVYLCNGVWCLSLPQGMPFKSMTNDEMTFPSREEIFERSRDKTNLAKMYSSYISVQLSEYSKSEISFQIGALIIEPVIQGAGGMLMIDPLFQRVLIDECRTRSIPVIFDEVFTGFWRLGTETAAKLLGSVPDIACFAKLMTGGIIPLAATLATNAIFESFVGDSKLKALLHGHSYSGHAMGCTAAAKSIRWFKDPKSNANINDECNMLRELWDMELVRQISSHPSVQRVIAIGTLFALELRAQGCNAGYASLYARSLLQKLRENGVYMRPLGNVIYLMCGPCTSPEICRQLLLQLQTRLEEFYLLQQQQASC